MKMIKKYRLVAEDRFSAWRIMSVAGLGLLIGYLMMDTNKILHGGFQSYESYGTGDWAALVVGYGFAIFAILVGLIMHSRVKWPEFEEELYDDGWIRYRFYGNGRYEDVDTWIPGDLIVRIQKYKKRYSRRKKNWYVKLNIDMLYEGKAYTAVSFGWLKEPKSIEEFEEYVKLIKKQIEKNKKGKEVKITFSMSGYSVSGWYKDGYATKINEERNKQIEIELSNGEPEHEMG